MKRLVILGLGSLLAASAAYAHHSFARDYAEEKQISLEGDIVSFEYRNPHAWVYFNAADGSGVVRRFGAEWANPRRLEQQGVGATDLRPGESIRRPADGWTWPGGRGRSR